MAGPTPHRAITGVEGHRHGDGQNTPRLQGSREQTWRRGAIDRQRFAVEQALKTLGANLRTARLRRNLTLQELAEKIGVERHAVAAAEKGKPSTGIAIYAALLWALGLLDHLSEVAEPERDEEGKALARAREPARPRQPKGLSDDF